MRNRFLQLLLLCVICLSLFGNNGLHYGLPADFESSPQSCLNCSPTPKSGSASDLPPAPAGCKWSENLVTNGDLSSNNMSAFSVYGDGVSVQIINEDGANTLKVVSRDYVANLWDSQLFIRLNGTYYEGDTYYVSFSCKADHIAGCRVEAQYRPGTYNWWDFLNPTPIFTPEWENYSWEGRITSEQAGIPRGNDGMGAITFDFNIDKQPANIYYFRDIVVRKALPIEGYYSQLFINEIQVANNDLFVDPSFNYGSWIELYNASDEDVSIVGLHVSDDPNNPKKYCMPSSAGVIPAKGYRNIWFDHNSADGSFSDMASMQVRFKLNMEGGTIYISDPSGNLIQNVVYPPAIPRCSYARLTDGGMDWATTGTPSPEQSNEGSDFATLRLDAPEVSCESGLFKMGTSFNFDVSIPDGASLFYSLDGSTPTRTSRISEDGHFTVDTTSIYRFCVIKEGWLPSPVVTRSFIFKNRDYYLPVVSVVTNPDNLYDDIIGLYTKGTNGIPGRNVAEPTNWNRDWERPVNLEYLIPQENIDGEVTYHEVVNQEVDFEICGGWSRSYGGGKIDGRTWPMKSSFRLKSSKYYDSDNEIPYAVFPSKPHNKYKSWHIRNGGQDFSRVKDAILQQIILRSGFNVDCQDYQPSHVFFNGEYLGMLNIREVNNKNFAYSNWGIDTDEMDQFELSGAYNQKAGDNKVWKELVSLSETLAENQQDSDYERIKQLLDVDEFINYMALQCYMCTLDWLPQTNNVKAYRSREDNGKFRFVLFDIDSALERDVYTIFEEIIANDYGSNVDNLFRNLLNYPAFKRQFLDAMCIVEGSIFVPKECQEVATNIVNNVQQAASFENLSVNYTLSKILSQLLMRYKRAVVSNVAAHPLYSVSDPYWVNLSSNIEEGSLLINGQHIPNAKFDGRLYNCDEKGIYLSAQVPAGYRFSGWVNMGDRLEDGRVVTTLISNVSTWEYYDQGSMDDYAWETIDFDAVRSGWKTNGKAPFGYGDNRTFMQNNSNTILDYGSDPSHKRTTYYFRKSFWIDHEPTQDEQYLLNYQVDDGFAFYINGKFISGLRVSEKDRRYGFTTRTYVGDIPDFGTFYIDPLDLHQGWNVLAVEVHNSSYSSADVFWDCELQCLSSKDIIAPIISAEPSFCLSNDVPGVYNIVAQYEKITDPIKRYESGAVPIRINEVSASNDIYINDYHKKKDWVELYNTTDGDIDLAGLYLSDNAKKPQKWQISGASVSTIIPAHGTRVVWCDELEPISQLHAPFKLDNADGASVSIQAVDGSWADNLTYFSQPRWHTYGRYPDGSNFTTLLDIPTIDKRNQCGTFDYAGHDSTEDSENAITLSLAEGWNWSSHNLSTDISLSRFSFYAQEMRSQTSQLVNDAQLGWQGDLKSIGATQGYKLLLTNATDITLRGYLYDCQYPVSLLQGWNWIGVPLKNATHLPVALEYFNATDGDEIVGLDDFATYYDGEWHGPLTSLQPGQAYLFKVGLAQDFKWNDVSFPDGAREHRYMSAQREDVAPWDLDIHAYPNVMTMVAILDVDGIDLKGNYYVGAFCGEECRGIARQDDELLYMNIHGKGDESIRFCLLDSEGNRYTSSWNEKMVSQSGLGDFATPYHLQFSCSDIEDVIHDEMASNVQVVRIEYFNLNGQRMTQPKGVCLQRLQMSDGKMIVKKVKR